MPADEREGELIASIRIRGGQLSLDLRITLIDALRVDGIEGGFVVGASEMDGEELLRGAAVWISDLEIDEDVLVFALLEMVVGGVAWIEGP